MLSLLHLALREKRMEGVNSISWDQFNFWTLDDVTHTSNSFTYHWSFYRAIGMRLKSITTSSYLPMTSYWCLWSDMRNARYLIYTFSIDNISSDKAPTQRCSSSVYKPRPFAITILKNKIHTPEI